MYNIKLPSPLSSFDASSDGVHFGIGMVDGSFLLRSKKFTREYWEDGSLIEDDEERLLKELSKENLSKTSKDYKYFHWG